jgi:hypothetical protein
MQVMRANPFLPGLPVTTITRFQKQPLLQTSLKGLILFSPITRRSPISSANAGLNDLIPLGFSGSRGWRISRLELNSVNLVNPVCLAEKFEPVHSGCYHGANGQTQFHRTAGLRADPHHL